MRDHSTQAHPELARLIASAPSDTLRLFEQAAVEIVVLPVETDSEFDEARTRFHRALERVGRSDPRLVHELEAAFSSAIAAATRALAVSWLRDLGWLPFQEEAEA